MKLRPAAIAALAFLLVAAMPRAPFHLSALQSGKPAVGVPNKPGKPLVIVAFASWCIGCVEELPQVVADYHRFKGRVDFLGVDYLDNPAAGRALVKKFHIPFPVVSDRPSNTALPPVKANAPDPNMTIHLDGVTPQMLPTLIAQSGDKFPASIRDIFSKIATYCKAHSDAKCRAYASAHRVLFSPTAAPQSTPTPSGATKMKSYMSLPHTFIIDGQGVVRADVTGYSSTGNPIAAQLRKLGITAP